MCRRIAANPGFEGARDMDFALSEEHQMLKDLVGRFVREQLMPLEPAVLERETCGKGIALTDAERAPLDSLSR